jgi:hypothetical protein
MEDRVMSHPSIFRLTGQRAVPLKKALVKHPFLYEAEEVFPIVSDFEEVLGIKSILMGFGLDSDAIHSPNENYPLFNFYKGIETIPLFYKYYRRRNEVESRFPCHTWGRNRPAETPAAFFFCRFWVSTMLKNGVILHKKHKKIFKPDVKKGGSMKKYIYLHQETPNCYILTKINTLWRLSDLKHLEQVFDRKPIHVQPSIRQNIGLLCNQCV